jgi:hypothetical protein
MSAAKVGRPTGKAFADDQVEELLVRLAKGETLTSICDDPRMPHTCNVYRWAECDKEFSQRFRDARALGVHALVDETLAIADEPVTKDDSVKVADKRLRIDTRLRLAGKWLSSVYGDRVEVNNRTEVIHRHDLSGYSADELDALEKLVAKSADASGDQGGARAEKSGSVH